MHQHQLTEVHRGLRAAVGERKVERDRVLGADSRFTVTLGQSNPHVMQVQSWRCGVPRDCDLKAVLATGFGSFSSAENTVMTAKALDPDQHFSWWVATPQWITELFGFCCGFMGTFPKLK